MSLFSRRRNIKGLFRSIRFIFNEPSFLKFILLITVLTFVLSFRFWAENRAPHLRIQASENVLRTVSSQPRLHEKKSRGTRFVDVNRATQKELESLPGIGPKLADAIRQDRLQNGPFHRADDLLRVKGIGLKRLEKISPFLLFSSDAKR